MTVERFADIVRSIGPGIALFTPEIILLAAIVVLVLAGLFHAGKTLLTLLASAAVCITLACCIHHMASGEATEIFSGMLRHDTFGTFMKILFNTGTLLAIWMSWLNPRLTTRISEYYTLLISTLLGAHLLAMSTNFVMVFISLELISLGSYVLTGYAFDRRGAEGSFKYFVFGSVASAIMLYGFTMLYGISGTLTFNSAEFSAGVASNGWLIYVASLMAMAGFFYKIAAAPMHPWSPDAYEAAPMPVVAFFSVVPKLAGLAVLIRFVHVLPAYHGDSLLNWQSVLAVVAMLSITVGNFSALWQNHPRRLMAWSSIAQAGFLLVGVVAADQDGLRLALFYAGVYVASNFLVFIYLQYFESKEIESLESFSGTGRSSLIQSIFLLVGLIALTGLPPTAGFTAKLFVFSSLWESYAASGRSILLWLLVFGLLNTVVSLFYYIRIPYFAFIRPGARRLETNFLSVENLFGLVIVVVVLGLFFKPGLLMGWINKINFVL